MTATDEHDDAMQLPERFVRRGQLIALLEVMNDGLPELTRRDHSSSGFVDEARSRTCPDCLANGRVMFGCETCGGSGEVKAAQVDAIALADALPDDGVVRDPYKVTGSDKTVAYGLLNEQRDREVAIESAIVRSRQELRRFPGFRPNSTSEEIEEANQHPYVWERERDALRRRYDIDRMAIALDELRVADEAGYHLLHSVYVYGWSEPSATMEMIVERALLFIDARMPTPIRAPGDAPVAEHPASARIRRRKAA